MNKFFKTICISCAAALALGSVGALAACSSDSGDKTESVKYTVNFETNGGSEVASQQVEAGGKATKPDDPTKTDYIFDDWYKEATFANVYDFDTETVSSDTTIYANWIQGTAATATFYLNYDADGNGTADDVYEKKTFADGNRISSPADPTREGYVFDGWYTDDAYTTAYRSAAKYSGSQSFYAKWLKGYTFEAENTQVTGLDTDDDTVTDMGYKIGYGYSGSANGINLISSHANASGGKCIEGIWYEGAYVDFEITSDKAETGAKLYLVLSARYVAVTLNTGNFKVLVNGTAVSYNDINLSYGADYTNSSQAEIVFTQFYINNINLVEGKNVIRLYVDNDEGRVDGTIKAMAPIVDCIKIYSTAALTMTEYENK